MFFSYLQLNSCYPYDSVSQSNVFHTRAVHVVHWAAIVPKRRPRNECAKKRKKIWGPKKSDKWRSRAVHRWEPTAFTFDWKFTSSEMLRCVTERLFPDVLEDRKALICRAMQPKSTASLGSLAIKLVLLAEPLPRAIYAYYVECRWQTRTRKSDVWLTAHRNSVWMRKTN